MVYVFEGDGKGKTSAALGSAVRMLLAGKRVEWIAWFKNRKWQISESHLPLYFKDCLKMHWQGEGFFIKNGVSKTYGKKLVKTARAKGAWVLDTASEEAHRLAAAEALVLAGRVLGKKRPPDLLVLDEVIQAVNESLISEEAVINLLEKKGKTHLILTGHDCPPKIMEKADLVTKMVKVKHPYDQGVLAVRGLDY